MVAQAEKKFPDLNGLSLLIIDDDTSIISSLKRLLSGMGAQVHGVNSVRQARLSLEKNLPDAVLADLQLKDGTGLELLPEFLGNQPDGAFYLITGHGTIDNAVEALRKGARHYFEKPVDPFALAQQLAADLADLQSRESLTSQLASYMTFSDPVMAEALRDLPRFAASNEPVLIQGETGTGKELVARALHGLSPRAQNPFIAVNCGAIPDTMLEAELFGHEKGAFTGANHQHIGRFEQANKSTLFLDEIGDMPMVAQVSLLRVLEEGVVQRIGGQRDIPVDVRVVAATHQLLEERVEANLFRHDLLFRLNVLPIHLPPLRERPADINPLGRRFLTNSLRDMGWNDLIPILTPEALARLTAYPWQGNVRELRNFMARLAVRLPHGAREINITLVDTLLPSHTISKHEKREGVLIPKNTTLADAEWLLIDAALKDSGYNRIKTAKLLGIGERTLRRKLNKP